MENFTIKKYGSNNVLYDYCSFRGKWKKQKYKPPIFVATSINKPLSYRQLTSRSATNSKQTLLSQHHKTNQHLASLTQSFLHIKGVIHVQFLIKSATYHISRVFNHLQLNFIIVGGLLNTLYVLKFKKMMRGLIRFVLSKVI